MAGTKDGQKGQGTVKGNSSWRGNREGQGAGWKEESKEREQEQGETWGTGRRSRGWREGAGSRKDKEEWRCGLRYT